MSHYEERLQSDLTHLRALVRSVSDDVERALEKAIRALLTGNSELAYATVLGDGPINRSVRQLDKLCHSFIARHLPGAGHLRLISSVIRVNIELERVGDYAVTICREAVQLSRPPDAALAREISLMAEEARGILSQATAAFNAGDASAAKATMPAADRFDHTYAAALQKLVSEAGDRPLRDLLAFFMVFNMLERVTDQAKNLCEEAVFAATGETKAAKVYRVLFLDEDGACLGPLAEAIARKRHPESGDFRAAARAPAAQLHPGLSAFMEERGLELPEPRPRPLDLTPDELADTHVIVTLQGDVRDHVAEVPFETVVLAWDVGAPPEGDPADAQEHLAGVYRELAARIGELMELLRGEGAA